MLGVRSIVGDACTLRNVVMMGADNYGTSHDNIELGVAQGTYIEETIIDKNARIGSEVVLSPKGLNEGWVDEKQNIYCKDGILVVVKNGVVENGTKIGNPV